MAIASDEPRFYVSSRFLVVSMSGENSAFPRGHGLDSYHKRLLQAVPAQNPHGAWCGKSEPFTTAESTAY